MTSVGRSRRGGSRGQSRGGSRGQSRDGGSDMDRGTGRGRAVVALGFTAAMVGAACAPDELATRPGTATAATGATARAAGETAGPAAAPATEAEVLALLAGVVEQPTSDGVRQLTAAMASSGDPKWAPYLVDLVRVGVSNVGTDEAFDALAGLTGIDRPRGVNQAYLTYGNWVLERAPDPGPGYKAFKVEMYRGLDPDFGPLLEQIDDNRLLAGLQWGGVPFGAIRELNDPVKAAPASLGWARPNELVVSGSVDGDIVGYPVRIVGKHELVNDTVAGRQIVMSYCTLCRTATIYDRRVGDHTLDFVTSGLLLQSNKVMVDRQTSTLWQQLTGEALAGPLAGTRLAALPTETFTWREWTATHPEATALAIPEPFIPDPEAGGALTAYDYRPETIQPGYYASDELWYPVLDTPEVFALKAEVVTIELDGRALAVGRDELAAAGPQVVELAARRLAVVPTEVGARVYDVSGPNAPPPGPLPAGVSLPDVARLANGQSFWFAWYGIHPDTEWWPR